MSDVVETLRATLGADSVLSGDDIPARHGADASGLDPTLPLAVILPRSTEEVSAAIRICHAHRQPVVSQGGLTGLAGGAHPRGGEVALSLERLVGIEEIDETSGTLTALAGTPLQRVQEAAAQTGFLCGIDLGARGSCTIGGNIATNAGGNQVLRYGMARRNVLGLEVVLADGTVVRSLNKMLKNNAGYDWTQLFIGSEGTLGVVTRVVLGLHPRPEGVETALLAVAGIREAVAVQRRLERSFPGGLLVFEGMWREFMSVAQDVCALPAAFAESPEIVLLTEVATGTSGAGRDLLHDTLGQLLDEGIVGDAVIAQSVKERERFWAYREAPYSYGGRWPKIVGFDVSIPISRMADAVASIRGAIASTWNDATHVYFGHIADSNLHVIVTRPNLGDAEKHAIEDVVYDVVARFGGSVSAEHGIGRNKRPYLGLSRSETEIALMSTIKRALDPAGILNPERVL